MKAAAAVLCGGLGVGDGCGLVDLTPEQYEAQLGNPWAHWRCPLCRAEAVYDDARSELLQGISPPDDDEVPR